MSAAGEDARPSAVIDSRTVFVGVPCGDGRLDVGCVGGLLACQGMYGALSFMIGNSNISHARDLMARRFLKSGLEWFVAIDSDIQFTRRDLEFLLEDDGAPVVCAEYARKEKGAKPVRFGFGFVRIHRSVFDTLRKLENPDGAPVVQQWYQDGELVDDFHTSGAVGEGRFVTEDQYFFTLVHLSGITPRIEQRTRLVHWGRAAWEYDPQAWGESPPASNDPLQLPELPAG